MPLSELRPYREPDCYVGGEVPVWWADADEPWPAEGINPAYVFQALPRRWGRAGWQWVEDERP